MKRYAVCGVSNRGIKMFIESLAKNYSSVGRVVGLLDVDPLRFEACVQNVPQTKDAPTYGEDEFDKMVSETRPDVILAVGADFTHAEYAVAALAHDLDVIVEKPMATNVADCKRILEAEAKSKGKVTVTFNYRYPAVHRRLKELLLEDAVGRITSVDLNWYVDTYHGASYFKRWNRQREKSGGLSIHKCSHHFDLLQWWLDQEPVEVFAFGALNYYGPDGEFNPKKEDGRFCGTCDVREDCAYFKRWQPHRDAPGPKDDHLGSVSTTKAAGNYTDYRPDACIFDSEINVEDTYTATIRYNKGALVSYSANYSCPYEGYRLAINGTKGRIETQEYHAVHRCPFPPPRQTIQFFPLFGGARETIEVLQTEGGHGGGDPLILDDLFYGPDPRRPYQILAGARQGALAVAVGEAVWRSCRSGKPVCIDDLFG